MAKTEIKHSAGSTMCVLIDIRGLEVPRDIRLYRRLAGPALGPQGTNEIPLRHYPNEPIAGEHGKRTHLGAIHPTGRLGKRLGGFSCE